MKILIALLVIYFGVCLYGHLRLGRWKMAQWTACEILLIICLGFYTKIL